MEIGYGQLEMCIENKINDVQNELNSFQISAQLGLLLAVTESEMIKISEAGQPLFIGILGQKVLKPYTVQLAIVQVKVAT